jgi:hypothetical protein
VAAVAVVADAENDHKLMARSADRNSSSETSAEQLRAAATAEVCRNWWAMDRPSVALTYQASDCEDAVTDALVCRRAMASVMVCSYPEVVAAAVVLPIEIRRRSETQKIADQNAPRFSLPSSKAP